MGLHGVARVREHVDVRERGLEAAQRHRDAVDLASDGRDHGVRALEGAKEDLESMPWMPEI